MLHQYDLGASFRKMEKKQEAKCNFLSSFIDGEEVVVISVGSRSGHCHPDNYSNDEGDQHQNHDRFETKVDHVNSFHVYSEDTL
jgi:hypothetical protein